MWPPLAVDRSDGMCLCCAGAAIVYYMYIIDIYRVNSLQIEIKHVYIVKYNIIDV